MFAIRNFLLFALRYPLFGIICSLAYAGFSKGKGRGTGNLRIRKTKMKRSFLRFSPFFCPDLGENQKKEKKGLHAEFARFFNQV